MAGGVGWGSQGGRDFGVLHSQHGVGANDDQRMSLMDAVRKMVPGGRCGRSMGDLMLEYQHSRAITAEWLADMVLIMDAELQGVREDAKHIADMSRWTQMEADSLRASLLREREMVSMCKGLIQKHEESALDKAEIVALRRELRGLQDQVSPDRGGGMVQGGSAAARELGQADSAQVKVFETPRVSFDSTDPPPRRQLAEHGRGGTCRSFNELEEGVQASPPRALAGITGKPFLMAEHTAEKHSESDSLQRGRGNAPQTAHVFTLQTTTSQVTSTQDRVAPQPSTPEPCIPGRCDFGGQSSYPNFWRGPEGLHLRGQILKQVRSLKKFEPIPGEANDTSDFTCELKYILDRYPSLPVSEKVHMLRLASSRDVSQLIDRQPEAIRSDFEALLELLQKRYPDSPTPPGIDQALKVKQKQSEHPGAYLQRLRKAYFGSKNFPGMDEVQDFKILFVLNLHPAITDLLGIWIDARTQDMATLSDLAERAYSKGLKPLEKSESWTPEVVLPGKPPQSESWTPHRLGQGQPGQGGRGRPWGPDTQAETHAPSQWQTDSNSHWVGPQFPNSYPSTPPGGWEEPEDPPEGWATEKFCSLSDEKAEKRKRVESPNGLKRGAAVLAVDESTETWSEYSYWESDEEQEDDALWLGNIIAKGPGKHLSMPVVMEGLVKVNATLDTASSVTVMSEGLLERLRQEAWKNDMVVDTIRCRESLRPYSTEKTLVEEMSFIKLTLGPISFTHKVLVSPIPSPELLIGQDCLLRLDPLVDCKRMELWMQRREPKPMEPSQRPTKGAEISFLQSAQWPLPHFVGDLTYGQKDSHRGVEREKRAPPRSGDASANQQTTVELGEGRPRNPRGNAQLGFKGRHLARQGTPHVVPKADDASPRGTETVPQAVVAAREVRDYPTVDLNHPAPDTQGGAQVSTVLAALQRADPTLNKMLLFLRNKSSCPISKKALRKDKELKRLHQNVRKLKVKHGLLMFVPHAQAPSKLVVPLTLRKAFLTLANDPKFARHGGVHATWRYLQRRAYWPQMQVDLEEFGKAGSQVKSTKEEELLVLKWVAEAQVHSSKAFMGVDKGKPRGELLG